MSVPYYNIAAKTFLSGHLYSINLEESIEEIESMKALKECDKKILGL